MADDIKLDCSEIENVRFVCREQCGKCCFYQAPILTTTEINRILLFLKSRPYEQFENFIIDLFTYNNRLDEATDEAIRVNAEALMWFWSPFQLEETPDSVIVRNYTVHSMPSTGRCMLLNPIDMKCFVYEARPDTCRIYPFTQNVDDQRIWHLVVAMKNCFGLTNGPSNLNFKEYERILKEDQESMRKDINTYEKYIAEKGVEIIRSKKKRNIHTSKEGQRAIMEYEKSWAEAYYMKKGNRRFTQALNKGKKFVEPLAEVGLVPPNPIILQYNEALKSRNVKKSMELTKSRCNKKSR